MPGRIITAQRQLSEIGRIRTGYTGPKGPVRSKTFIITGGDPDVMEAAAAEWGGKVETWTPLNGKNEELKVVTEADRIAVWLPPGDPLSQHNEIWNRGGATRRCDGAVEKFSGKSCLCTAEFGEEWYRQDKRVRCQTYSHLNILALQLPDIGQLRLTTKSHYAAGEIAGQVDFIKSQVGMEPTVPIWFFIDHREKVAEGKTTPYPVPRIRIRGVESGLAMLGGGIPRLQVEARERQQAIGGGTSSDQPALPSAQPQAEPLTVEKVIALAKLTKNLPQVQQLWKDATEAGIIGEGNLRAILKARGDEFDPTKQKPAAVAPSVEVSAEEQPVEADDEEPDPDATWAQINATAGRKKWSAKDLEDRVIAFFNKSSDEINGWQMQQFLAAIKSGEVS